MRPDLEKSPGCTDYYDAEILSFLTIVTKMNELTLLLELLGLGNIKYYATTYTATGVVCSVPLSPSAQAVASQRWDEIYSEL